MADSARMLPLVRLTAVVLVALASIGAGAPSARANAVPTIPLAQPGQADSSAEQAATDLREAINGIRGEAGLPPVAWYWPASTVATSWAQQMASEGTLSHNLLAAAELNVAGAAVAENVGHLSPVGPVDAAADRMLSAFMASPMHQANLLSRHSHIGVGVAIHGESMWVTTILLTPDPTRPVHYRR